MSSPTAQPQDDPYPGGSNAPGYRIAFQVWMALFLLTICAGLLSYLLTWWQSVR